uniref:G-protein coupled receptors family 1 profile domain-containing protein n=1 Tax=Leptobrachium leishanense TaxID=445787 RepID=A0A8C5W6P4_9ANUR
MKRAAGCAVSDGQFQRGGRPHPAPSCGCPWAWLTRRTLINRCPSNTGSRMASSENLCFMSWEMKDLHKLHEGYSSILRQTSFVLSIIVCVVGFLGNAVVIWATGFVMKKKYPSKIWFLNLAIADFVFLVCLPLDAAAEFKENWSFGSPLCKVYNFLSIANMYTSIFIITALNIDRALAVAKPIWHLKCFTQCIRYCICAGIWSVTVLGSVPAIIFGGEVETRDKTVCTLFHVEDVELHRRNPSSQVLSFNTDMFDTFKRYLTQCRREQCCATENALTVWNQMVFSTKCLVIPLLVIGYFIPLCVILTSNIIIALETRKSKKVKSARLYRIIITVFIVHLVTWTPLVVAQIILLVAVQKMNIILVYKGSVTDLSNQTEYIH